MRTAVSVTVFVVLIVAIGCGKKGGPSNTAQTKTAQGNSEAAVSDASV